MKKYLAAALALTATPAFAHHPLNGLPMETFSHGLLSGVGHPILGFDHLFFIVAVGILASFTASRLTAPLAYILTMLAGCVFVSLGFQMPLTEGLIVLSLLTLGGILASGRMTGQTATLALFAAFGFVHGAAFGGTIAGQEGGAAATVFTGYLIGLAAIQYAIAIGAGWLARTLFGATDATATNARLIGAGIAGVGAFLALEIVEGPIVAALTGAV
ncbi:HupE/UreJ family protein [Aestuariibius sp. 2305UL40-4]|uniref:HupE/UreJ family protein n=1 Tax=Aestuariibius violaceus TaxID=3234132 RepID=UPI00345E4CE4